MNVYDWRILVSGDAYDPPEVRRFKLQGSIDTDSDNNFITTSAIVEYGEHSVITRSGSVYQLVGEPELGDVAENVSVYASMAEAVAANPWVPLT